MLRNILRREKLPVPAIVITEIHAASMTIMIGTGPCVVGKLQSWAAFCGQDNEPPRAA